MRTATADAWADALAREINERRRAECMARIQSDAVQLALDLLVREPDIDGFFRVFIKTLVEECESHACGVWLLDDDESAARCDLWMAYVEDRFYTRGQRRTGTRWRCRARAWPRTCSRYAPGWTETIEYTRRRRAPARAGARRSTARTASSRVAGRAARAADAQPRMDRAVVPDARRSARRRVAPRAARGDGAAGDAGAAPEPARRAEPVEERRKAMLEERNRLARDIHDTLAQGFAAILMQLQARAALGGARCRRRVARSIETAVDLARTHMIEARRSVGALRPQRARRGRRRRRSSAWSSSAQRTHRRPDRAHHRRAAAVRRRRRARDRRHRAGSADQRRPPRARAAHHDPRATASARSASGCRWPTTAAASPASAAARASA